MARAAELSVADRAALFSVVDACCSGSGPFGERMLEALARHLNYRDTTYFNGMDPADALKRKDIVVHGRAQHMLPEYLERYAETDIFKSAVALRQLSSPGVTAMHLLPSIQLDRHRPYVENFIRGAGARTIFAAQIDAGSAGTVLVGILDFADRMGQVDLFRLAALRRVLSAELERECRRVAQADVKTLTHRELEIAELVGRGLTNADIARQIGLQIDTVKKHLTRIYQTFGVSSRTQLALRLR
jgi:DNA-binding NarL/FixJ family response regulator